MRIEHKSIPFEVKLVADPVQGGEYATWDGVGAAFHNLDATGDIIAPGAFADGLDAFLKDGFIGGVGHNWNGPIGHPVEARETPEGLYVKAVFDDTPEAQAVRAMMRRNPVSGRATLRKLSIGYRATESERFDGPAEVKSYWQAKGYTPGADEHGRLDALYRPARDEKGREVRPRGARMLRKVSLYEVSPVAVPANDRAMVISAKSLFGYGMGGPMAGDPDDLEDAVRDAVLSTLHNFLCMALRAIVANDMLSGDDRIALIGPAFDQARDATIQYLKPLMGGEAAEDIMEDVAETLETMGKVLAARLPEAAHQYTVKALAPASGAGLDDYFPTVEPALRDFCARNRARLDIRLKEGRVLSSANVERMERMRDSLRSHADDLHSMVETARPKPKDGGKSPFGGTPAGVMSVVTLGGPAGKSESDSADVEAKGGHPVLHGDWDAKAAESNVRKWASSDGSGDRGTIDWDRYGRAFAHVVESKAGRSFSDHHLIHHDVADGRLHVSRKGVLAAARADHPEAHAGAIRAHLGGHFDQLKMTAPWDRGEGKSADDADDAQSPPAPPDLSAYFLKFYATDPALLGVDVAIK